MTAPTLLLCILGALITLPIAVFAFIYFFDTPEDEDGRLDLLQGQIDSLRESEEMHFSDINDLLARVKALEAKKKTKRA